MIKTGGGERRPSARSRSSSRKHLPSSSSRRWSGCPTDLGRGHRRVRRPGRAHRVGGAPPRLLRRDLGLQDPQGVHPARDRCVPRARQRASGQGRAARAGATAPGPGDPCSRLTRLRRTGLLTGPRDAATALRRARDWDLLAEDLASLGSELQPDLAWLSPSTGKVESLCPGWTVRDIVVHLVVGDDLAVRTLAGENCFASPTVDESVLAHESRERVAEWEPVPVDEAVAVSSVAGAGSSRQSPSCRPTIGAAGRPGWRNRSRGCRSCSRD